MLVFVEESTVFELRNESPVDHFLHHLAREVRDGPVAIGTIAGLIRFGDRHYQTVFPF